MDSVLSSSAPFGFASSVGAALNKVCSGWGHLYYYKDNCSRTDSEGVVDWVLF